VAAVVVWCNVAVVVFARQVTPPVAAHSAVVVVVCVWVEYRNAVKVLWCRSQPQEGKGSCPRVVVGVVVV